MNRHLVVPLAVFALGLGLRAQEDPAALPSATSQPASQPAAQQPAAQQPTIPAQPAAAVAPPVVPALPAALTQPPPPPESQPATQPAATATAQSAPASRPAGPDPRVAAEQAQKKAARLQKLQQVQFDRRPSTILRTWSTPPEPPASQPASQPGSQPASQPASQPDSQPAAQPVVAPPAEAGEAPQAMIQLPNGQMVPAPMAEAAGEPTAAPGPDGAPRPAASKDPFDRELAAWKRDVTLGNWAGVKAFLASLAPEEQKVAWPRLLTGLRMPPQDPNQPQQAQQMPGQQQGEQNQLAFEDILALAGCAPMALDDKALQALGLLLRVSLDRGNVLDRMLELLRAESARPEGQRALSQRQAAKLLAGASLLVEAGEFLPTVDAASEQKDHEALNLLSKHFIASHQKDKKLASLEQAWRALLAIFAAGKIDKPQEDEALRGAVDLAPKLRAELGKTWLAESFTRNPQRGMRILASIGTAAATGLMTQPGNVDFRLKSLQLQSTAVTALLDAAPQLAQEWRPTLNLLASNWLKEAQATYRFDRSTSFGPQMRRDVYGNWYWVNPDGDDENSQQMYQQPGMVQGIKTAEILELRPGTAWLACVEEGLRPRFAMVFAQLYLKVQEDNKAFPFIEQLASTHPAQARELVKEFLRVWTNNHDPNAQRNRTYSYIYMYGYEQKAESIPLTRSKQERNLTELADVVARLRKLPSGNPDVEQLAKAFTTCHSSAEVYRLEAIEKVFGSLEQLEPKTLAALAHQMRTNLGGVWRQAGEQEKNKTRRKQKDIQAEVVRGYDVARTVVQRAMEQHPEAWELLLARATLDHDLNNYQQEIQKDPKFAGNRTAAFADFERAADLYVARIGKMPVEDESTKAFEHWFYAALGASDLQFVTDETIPDLRQIERIKGKLAAIPGEANERHRARFASTLFTRMSSAKPAVKYRYLRGGFDIVGDHKAAYEARKVFDYYKDIVTEIRLQTRVDGSDVVGHGRPFGVFVNLVHTREIERESGGFGRYLQNQNTVQYSYNYGRPTENYRDKFSEAARQALSEHFEVLSVTFESDTVHSRAGDEYGWRVTPYAYLLLKARGPQIDKLPSLRLDLDFLDTSGYAVLPIESAPLPLDCAARTAEPRPVANLEITQILDERQADKGKLILEIKATGNGLVPELDQLLELLPPGFTQTKAEDSGAAVARFSPDTVKTEVVSERTWMLHFTAREDLEQRPTAFQFGRSRVADAKLVFQKYVDADLKNVEATTPLGEKYGEPRQNWLWTAVVIVALLLLAVLLLRVLGGGRRTAVDTGLQMPSQVTAFTVLGLLRAIQQQGSLDGAQRDELRTAIDRLEAHYFSPQAGDTPDLQALARGWLERSGTRRAAAG